MPLHAGTRLGPYEIQSALDAGGMGEVYKARDTRLDRTVAIKILPATLAADPEFRDRFEREARVISALDHPCICAELCPRTFGTFAGEFSSSHPRTAAIGRWIDPHRQRSSTRAIVTYSPYSGQSPSQRRRLSRRESVINDHGAASADGHRPHVALWRAERHLQ
jgi:serine/threonine protein kinase